MAKLRTYRVAVTESYRRVTSVRAMNEKDAHRRASDGWQNGEVLLTDEDFEGAEFYVLGEGKDMDIGNSRKTLYVIQGYGAKGIKDEGGEA